MIRNGYVPVIVANVLAGYLGGKLVETYIQRKRNAMNFGKDDKLKGEFISKTFCCGGCDFEVDRGDRIKIIQDLGDHVVVEIVGGHNNPQVMTKSTLLEIAEQISSV